MDRRANILRARARVKAPRRIPDIIEQALGMTPSAVKPGFRITGTERRREMATLTLERRETKGCPGVLRPIL
jgi:hypothetical protein